MLINPIRVAYDIISEFSPQETPEHTEGREGYVWFTDMTANPNSAKLKIAIRDFDNVSFAARKAYIGEVVAKVSAQYPRAKISYSVTDVYSNISNSIGEDKRAIDLIFSSMAELNIEPKVIPMRGGTDGAALSTQGLLTPNYFTGAHNFHSPFEFFYRSAPL